MAEWILSQNNFDLILASSGLVKATDFTADGNFLVGTGSGTYAAENGNTARTSLGLGTGDSPTFAGLTLTGNLILPDDGYIGSATSNQLIQLGDNNEIYFPQGLIGTDIGSNNFLIGSGIGSAASSIYSNLIFGGDIAGAIATVYANIILGNRVADASTTISTHSNIILGDDVFKNTTGQVANNIVIGSDTGNGITTGNSSYNVLISYAPFGNATIMNYNLCCGLTIGNEVTGTALSNLLIGNAIFQAATSISYCLANGKDLGSAGAAACEYNLFNGLRIFRHSTGVITDNTVSGRYIGEEMTGTANSCVLFGLFTLYQVTNEEDAVRIVAMPYESLRESSASTLDDAIAIGYRAGYQNAYNSPALFGREATATVNNQVVVGSTFYTGGIRLITDGTASIATNTDITLPEGKAIYFDSTDTYIKSNTDNPEDLEIKADQDVHILPDNATTIGDGGTTNYVIFANDGELNLFGTSRVKREIKIEPTDFNPGASGPNSALNGSYPSYEFTIGNDIYVSFEIPYDWDNTTAVEVELYWGINEAYATNNGEVQWYLDWEALAVGEDITSPGNTGSIDFGDVNINASTNILTKTEGTIAAASLAAGDIISLHVSRVALDDGNNPTAKPYLLEMHIEYTSNKLGEAL